MRIASCLLVLAFVAASRPAGAATRAFLSPSGGLWSDPLNWSPTGVPAPGDTVNINVEGTYTVTLDVDAELATLNLGAAKASVTLAILPGRTLALVGGFDAGGATNASVQNAGTFEFKGASGDAFWFGQSSTFTNTGTLRKVAGTGSSPSSSLVGFTFTSPGTVEVSTGILRLFNMPLATLSGPLAAVAGSALVLDTRTNLDDGAAFTGAGKLVATGFDTVRVVGSASATNLEQRAGTLDGVGTLTISGLYAFQGATMGGTGTTVILPGATLVAGVAGLAGATNVVQRTIDNQGTLVVEGLSSLGLSSGATLLNSGLVDLPGDRGFGNPGSPGGTTQNSGTIRKSGGAGESLVRGILHNLAGGTLEVQTGRLRLGDGGGTLTGAVDVVAGSSIVFDSFALAHVFLPGIAFTGGGFVEVGSGGFVQSDTNVVVERFRMGRIYEGTGDLTVTALFEWSSGALRGTGTARIPQGAVLDLVNGGGFPTVSLERPLEIAGSLVAKEPFNVVFSAGGGLTSSGTVDLRAAAKLTGAPGGFSSTGTLLRSTGAGFAVVSVPFLSSGPSALVKAQTGALRFTNSFTVTGGAVELAGGSIEAQLGLDLQGGRLSGTGTFTGNVTSAGLVSPGASPGILNLSGAFTQTAAGTLRVELASVSSYDQLSVSGLATLGGTLEIVPLGGFLPPVPSTYPFLTHGSRSGTFAGVVFDAGCSRAASVNYGGGITSISVSALTCPTPTLSAVSPGCANVIGGRTVTLTGTNFQPGAQVVLATIPATVTAVTPTQITVTTGPRPATVPSTGNVVVTNPDTQTATLPAAFTYAVRGDANGNGALTGADTFFLNQAIFLGGAQPPTLCNGDANGNGALTGADAFFLNLFVFLGGAAPPP
ncbi:MAG: IPT/TIG domain-containing protein [Acidobacteria bacterium]|nr:IPT/TIG domain-containing protein [Acidobacteriota bacterium]